MKKRQREWREDMRCEEIARYMVRSGATVRAAAERFGISKSTVHKDVTERLRQVHTGLYEEVGKLLAKNKAERHLRGGEATRAHYLVARSEVGKPL